jgi:hypothetical protein
MVQGSYKPSKASRPAKKLTGGKKYTDKLKVNARLGDQIKVPKTHFRAQALEDKLLSKAIHVANEQKVAAKLLSVGGKLSTTDIKSKGKELAREIRKEQVKKKVGRVEQKLINLKAEEDGTNVNY